MFLSNVKGIPKSPKMVILVLLIEVDQVGAVDESAEADTTLPGNSGYTHIPEKNNSCK